MSMAISALQVEEGLAQIAELTTSANSREEFVAGALDALLEMGFSRARFYEIAHDAATERDVVVLTKEAPTGTLRSHAGFATDLASSSVARNNGGLSPTVDHDNGDGDGNPDWVDTLDLKGRYWVEIPVAARGKAIGLIGCDWIEPANLIGPTELEALRVVGSQVGAYLGLEPVVDLERIRGHHAPVKVADPRQFVITAAADLAATLDAAVTAVFAFSWTEQALTKVYQYVHPQFRSQAEGAGELTERYVLTDGYLTSEAWTNESLRHIIDFASFKQHRHQRVAQESEAWHGQVLGAVRSVLYTVIGQHDPRYLIRFINKASAPELPFLTENVVLNALDQDFRLAFDAALTAQRLKDLQEITKHTAQTLAPLSMFENVARLLEDECIANCAIVCHQAEAAQFGFSAFAGPRLARNAFDDFGEWEQDRLYTSAVTSDYSVHALNEHKPARRGSLAATLLRAGFAAVVTVPFAIGQTRGTFLVPLDALPLGSRGRRAELPVHFGTLSLLHAYSRLVGNAVETRHSREKVDGARRALGLVGHELRGPLAELGSSAEESINTARRVIQQHTAAGGETVSDAMALLAMREQELYDRQEEVSAALELAPIVAQESEGTLQLHFRPTNLSWLIRSAVAEVEAELALERNPRQFDFHVARSARDLGPIVCDREYLRHVLKNLLRNAVKSSLPRYPDQVPRVPMTIDMIGEPQKAWVGVKVRNWGFGIAPDKKDVIFEPWVRGDLTDRLKAIRGMGLGLFLARRILAAHGGTILYRSVFTLDDKRRARDLEGFETTFEIRVPRDLPVGTHEHRWEPWRDEKSEAV